MALKTTPLHGEHVARKAKLIDFGGWEMPLQYTGIIEEHHAVRQAAGLFDVSHMGEIEVTGPDAQAFVQKLITNDIERLGDGQVLYSPMCYENGGTVDDLLVYRFNAEHFFLVVNAANTAKDFAWMQKHAEGYNLNLRDVSSEFAQLAIQGPKAEAILQRICSIELSEIRPFRFAHGRVNGVPSLISRTGYTGEDGFEIYFLPSWAPDLWNKILEAGEKDGIQPVGLGARDTLRFEACLPLYGNELSAEITPLEAGLEMFVKLEKAEFIGREALAAQKKEGVKRRIVGLEMIGRGIARSHYPVVKDGRDIGVITSGTYSPTLNKNVALALIAADEAVVGNRVQVMIRNKPVEAEVVKTPFYRRAR